MASKRLYFANVERGDLECALPTESMARVAFSPDGRWLVVSSERFTFWQAGTWTEAFGISRPPLVTFPSPVGFSRDGSMVAFCPDARSVRLANPNTGAEYATLELQNQWLVSNLSFSPDGTQLALAGLLTKEACVWDLRCIRAQLARLQLDWDLPPYPPDRAPASPHVR